MNPDQEMQAEAMDMAQDKILRLTEALGAEKEAHMETAKSLVACREELRASIEVMQKIQPMAEVDECAVACQIADNQDALSHNAGDDYVSKASVRPIVQVLRDLNDNDDVYHMEAQRDVRQALEQAKLLGL